MEAAGGSRGNLPSGRHRLELTPHVIDRLVQFVHLVVQITLLAPPGCCGGFAELAAILQTGDPEHALLAPMEAATFGLREQPPGQTSCSEHGSSHGTEQHP